MTTLSILLNKTLININEITPNNFYYIEDFINYKLSPYKQLNHFQYNTFSYEYIDGIKNSSGLRTLLYKNIRSMEFNLKVVFNSPIAFINLYTNCFFITTSEFYQINAQLENYCIIFSNLFR
ncbi:MAG: hypothetical protein K2N34_13715 [Lachnospiraceae bacterium]|nr:hypothetical protein [Lachnospiraceae bacterium]